MTGAMIRGVVICPRFAVTGRNIELNCDIKPTELRRYLLYWDKIAYAYPNGLGKPNLDALHDLGFLSEVGVLSLYDIPVGTRDIGMEEVPTPSKLSNANHLISVGQSTTKNPSGLLILGSPAHIWPQLSTCAQLDVATNTAPDKGGIWTIGECNAQLSMAIFPGVTGQLLEATLYASLPVPTDATPLEEIMEFRTKRKEELLQLRSAIDRLRSDALSQPDSARGVQQASEAIELALIQLHRCLDETGIRTFFSTLKLYLNVTDSSVVSVLLGTLGASGAGIPLSIGAAAGLAVNTILTFASRQLDVTRGLPAELSDFAYVYDINRYWPNTKD